MSRRNLLYASLLACLPLLVAAGGVAAQSQSSLTGKILFRTSAVDSDGTVRGSRLLRINADGSALRPLMPMVDGVFNGSPTWSPGGGLVAFERFNTLLDRTDIFSMDSQGQQLHRLTDGSTKFHKPAWGPGGTIAFVSDDGPVHWGYVGSCLGTIRADGSQQHLFCPGVVPAQRALSPIEVSRPTWTADGTSILIEAGYYGGLTAEEWYSAMYKVDARTGAATLLTWKIGEEGGTFAPNGSDAVYVQWGCPVQPPCSAGVLSIYRFDIASQQSTQLADGYAPLYSPDGSRIAFTRTFSFDPTQPDLPRYDQVFVMNADGSNVRQLTSTKVDNVEYLAADWSRDGTQLLVNRTLYSEQNGRRVNPRPALRIIDVNTGAITAISAGYAYPGAWFQPR